MDAALGLLLIRPLLGWAQTSALGRKVRSRKENTGPEKIWRYLRAKTKCIRPGGLPSAGSLALGRGLPGGIAEHFRPLLVCSCSRDPAVARSRLRLR